jgi:hypothetical protein
MTPGRTPAGARRPRLSKRILRRWAYVGGAVSFAVPWFVLSAVPKPPASAGAAQQQPQVIEVHKILRRIVVADPPNAPARTSAQQVRYVSIGGSGGGGGSVVHTKCSTC